MQKALKTANSEKFVFRVRRQVWCLSLQIRSFSEIGLQTFAVLWIPFSARKSRQIPSRRACHRSSPLAFGSKKVRKSGPVPEFRRVFHGTAACRGPCSERGSLPRSLVTVCHRLCHRSVLFRFWCKKALKTANSEKFVFRVSTASGMPEPLVFASRLQTLTLLRIPLSAGELACHRSSPLRHRSLLRQGHRGDGPAGQARRQDLPEPVQHAD